MHIEGSAAALVYYIHLKLTVYLILNAKIFLLICYLLIDELLLHCGASNCHDMHCLWTANLHSDSTPQLDTVAVSRSQLCCATTMKVKSSPFLYKPTLYCCVSRQNESTNQKWEKMCGTSPGVFVGTAHVLF